MDSNAIASIENELEVDENAELYKKVTERWQSHTKKVQKKGKKIFCLTLALDFIGFNDKPEHILLVNREWNTKLKKKVYKIMLSKPDEKLSINTRLVIWKNIMKLDEQKIDYFKLKEKYNLFEQKVLPVEDIITMDVQRSFHNHPNINTMILYNLLRLYAHYDPKVSYCQGMNYLMGFLYCHFRNEEISFKFFVAVVDRYMKTLFEHDLESLKASFYQLDRLIGIFLPDLSKHFKKEGVDSSLFSASWFITIFTNIFQFSRTSFTLMRILDIFLLEGWKGLFKVCIYVLGVYKDQMLRMKFDQLLGFLNDFSSKEFFTNFKYNEGLEQSKQFAFFDYQPYEEEKPVRYFASRIDDIKVTNEVLELLEAEYHKLNPPRAVKKY